MDKKMVVSKDLYDYKFPHDVNCSPDGEYAAFLLSEMDETADRYRHDIQLLHLPSGQITVLTRTGDIGAFAWLSKTQIMFTSSRKGPKKGTTDVFRIDIGGGEAQKMFTVPAAVSLPAAAGEGKWLVQTRKPTDPQKPEADRAVEGVDFWTFTDKPFLKNGAPFSERKRMALGIFDEKEGEIRYITNTYFETLGYDIDMERKRIIYYGEEYTACASPYQSLHAYDLETETHTELVSGGTYQISLAKCLASGRILLQASALDRSATQNHDLYLWAPDSKSLTLLQSPDGMYTTLIDVDTVYGGGRGSKVVGDKFIGVRLKQTKTVIEELDTYTGHIREIAQVDALTSFDQAGDMLCAVALENHELSEVYQIELQTGNKKKLTAYGDAYLKDHIISEPEKFSFEAKNGEVVEGFVIPPAQFDNTRRYPGVMFIHGGPKWAYGKTFMHLFQCLAAKGMFVMYCNAHGSDGYGENFLEMVGRWGKVDYEQLMEFVDECLKRYPNLDAERLGVSGGSYGAYMTNWIIGHTDRFRAAVSQRGISNLVTLALLSDLGDRVLRQSCGDCTPWNHEEVLWEHSPLKYAKHVKTPTLFLHSDQDYRCFMGEAFQMFTALKQAGVKTELYLFHGENHGLSRSGSPAKRVVRVDAITKWFEENL